eukprot:1159957-Pelagomonas_calceolata.AAC.5
MQMQAPLQPSLHAAVYDRWFHAADVDHDGRVTGKVSCCPASNILVRLKVVHNLCLDFSVGHYATEIRWTWTRVISHCVQKILDCAYACWSGQHCPSKQQWLQQLISMCFLYAACRMPYPSLKRVDSLVKPLPRCVPQVSVHASPVAAKVDCTL